jgi:hypothetical protein
MESPSADCNRPKRIFIAKCMFVKQSTVTAINGYMQRQIEWLPKISTIATRLSLDSGILAKIIKQ